MFGSNPGNYILAQEGAIMPGGSVNDTMSGKNATQWANATLAFAQEGFTTKDLVNETIDLGNSSTSNATLAFAQEGAIMPGGSVNDTMSGKNATQWANATLAFAQEGFTTKDLVNETIDLGNSSTSNATLAFAQEGAIMPGGSVNDTMSGKNATQWANATLAFAQEGFTTKDLVNETIDLGNSSTSNATLAFAQEGAIMPGGSVNDTMSGKNATQWANATLATALVS